MINWATKVHKIFRQDTIMKREKIIVPRGIRYLKDWKWFSLSQFPAKCIINKQIPGCGFTEYCISGAEDVILCSPRKILLENKYEQHKDIVYLVVNEMDRDPHVDKDIGKDYSNLKGKKINQWGSSSTEEDSSSVPIDRFSEMYRRLYSEIDEYCTRRALESKPNKILVTYDSYRIVKDILISQGRFESFYTVIDEFQSILHDARFKSSTELGFMQHLNESPTSLFVSATPMMEDYMEMLNEFKDLPYYELDWGKEDPLRIVRPQLKTLTMQSVGVKAKEIIGKYLSGNFEKVIVERGSTFEEVISNEAVFYVNSVNHIISIIRNSRLLPEQCNILCSKTPENIKQIHKKLGSKWDIGRVPVEGEQHKMFTFCTRTVYLGADFYSKCARTFIFSDSNSSCLAVDISEDLPQILGRQRLNENPWKNSATFYYRPTADYNKMTREDLQKIIDRKLQATEKMLALYEKGTEEEKKVCAENYKKLAKSYNYSDDYVAVNVSSDSTLIPVVNNLVRVNEIRAFNIQQVDYKDRFSVFNALYLKSGGTETSDKLYEEIKTYNSLKTIRDKYLFLCESDLSHEEALKILEQIPDNDAIKSSYLALGPNKLRALNYNKTYIDRELGIITFNRPDLSNKIFEKFFEGDRMTTSEVKRRLNLIYKETGYAFKPKARDLRDYFDLKDVKISDPVSGKRLNGLELLKRKG